MTEKIPMPKQARIQPSHINRHLQGNHKRKWNSHMQLEQRLTGSGEHKDSIGNDGACHTLEPKAEEEEDKAAPYEVPITTFMKPKNQ